MKFVKADILFVKESEQSYNKRFYHTIAVFPNVVVEGNSFYEVFPKEVSRVLDNSEETEVFRTGWHRDIHEWIEFGDGKYHLSGSEYKLLRSMIRTTTELSKMGILLRVTNDTEKT